MKCLNSTCLRDPNLETRSLGIFDSKAQLLVAMLRESAPLLLGTGKRSLRESMIQKPHCILLDAWSPVILCERNLWVTAMNVSWYSLSQHHSTFKDGVPVIPALSQVEVGVEDLQST